LDTSCVNFNLHCCGIVAYKPPVLQLFLWHQGSQNGRDFLPNFHVVFIGIFSQLVISVIYCEANVFAQFSYVSLLIHGNKILLVWELQSRLQARVKKNHSAVCLRGCWLSSYQVLFHIIFLFVQERHFLRLHLRMDWCTELNLERRILYSVMQFDKHSGCLEFYFSQSPRYARNYTELISIWNCPVSRSSVYFRWTLFRQSPSVIFEWAIV